MPNTPPPGKMLHSHLAGYFIPSKSVMQIQNQFLKWVLDWEKRVFPSIWKGPHQYCFNVIYCQQMEDCLKHYKIHSGDQLGQDRLAWTVFAKAILKDHYKMKSSTCSYSLRRCLYLLVWISFYLSLSNNLVKELLKEIIICNQNVKFLFTFLPGMSISLYISNFLGTRCFNFEDNLCNEFFSMIGEENRRNSEHMDVYRFAQPLIYHQVKNLSPLHGPSLPYESNYRTQKGYNATLISILDRKIFPQCQHNLLTLAIKYSDIPLINILLKNGTSAGIHLWDPIKEDTTTPERMMISIINSVMTSQKLLSTRENISETVLNSVQKMKNNISSYARILKRSLLQPESQKASSIWDGEKWKIELNKEIADEWGIGCTKPFPTLQHIAKITIRQKILSADRQLLPCAISELPIPYLLKCYLDLELD